MFRNISTILHACICLALVAMNVQSFNVSDIFAFVLSEPGALLLFLFIFVALKGRVSRLVFIFLAVAWYNNIFDGLSNDSPELSQFLVYMAGVLLIVDLSPLTGWQNSQTDGGSELASPGTRTCPSCHGTGTWAIGSAAIGSSQTASRMTKACSRCCGQGTIAS